MNRNFLLPLFWVSILTILPAICFGEELLVDDFDSGEGFVMLGPEETGTVILDIFGIDPGRTLGGERQIFASGEAPEIDSVLSVSLFEPSASPFFNEIVSFSASGDAGYRWGENTDLNLNLDQLDLSIENAVAIDPGLDFEVTASVALTSGRGGANEVTESVSRASIDSDQSDFGLSWQANEFSNVDFTDIDVIELSFGGENFRVNLESFTVNAIPEPGSLALLAAIGLATVIRRRR